MNNLISPKSINLLLFFAVISFSSIAQITIKGNVTDLNNIILESANIIIEDENKNILAYTYTKPNGAYQLSFNNNSITNIFIIVNSLGFEKKSTQLQLSTNKKEYLLDFQLKEKTEQLNEVVLKPTEKLKREGNVTTLKVSGFSKGREQTVEDILKELPGIEVLKDGKIKAHGKFIDKLLIEGDDMFDNKYQILSKNLDAKVLSAVQILDEFEDNPVLAKTSTSNKVAINLQLKEKYKNVWFGNISLGVGTEERIEVASNLGLIRKKIKLFNFNNYNNLGRLASLQVEDSPNSISSSNVNFKKIREPNIEPIFNINQNENSFFKEGQSIFNNALINSLSLVTNLSSKLKLRSTGYFTFDKENQLFNSQTVFNTQTPSITYLESNNNEIKNRIGGAEIELKHTSGDKSYLKNNFIYKNTPLSIYNQQLFNSNNITQDNNNKEFILLNKIQHSYLIGTKNALNTSAYIGHNRLNQNTTLVSPVLNNLLSIDTEDNIKTTSNDQLSVFGLSTNSIINTKKSSHTLELGYDYNQEKRKNTFIIHNNINVDSLQNQLNLKQHKTYFKYHYKYNISNKVEFNTGFVLDYINLKNNNHKAINKLLFNPKVSLLFKKMKIGIVRLSYYKNYHNLNSNLFINNYQLSSFQSFKKGTSDIRFFNNNTFSLSYFKTNYLKTKSITFKIRHSNSSGKYSTNNIINQNTILTSYRTVETGTNTSANLEFTSYFKKVNLSTNLGSIQNWSTTPIRINSSFNKLKNHIATYFLSGTTYFKIPLNFKFKLNLNFNQSEFNQIKTKTHWENFDLNSTYKFSREWILSINNNFYWINKNDYLFMNLFLNHTPKQSRFSYLFTVNNITNISNFSTISIDEYSTYQSNLRLLPRYFLASIKYRF